ncbi:MAG: FG-GAP-like repeat-containing protein, partial [Pseudomonadota bacterium]
MNRICRRLGVLLTSCVLGVAFAQSSPVLQAGSVFSSSKHESSALPRVLTSATPLSQNDETVGTLPGKLSVSSTGAANYTIPIEVPPGTAGMTPKLSLSYSSQNQNGMLGMGFALSGLTVITRTPSNLTQNGSIHGVDFTDADRFSLNGQQLVAVKGDYGQDQTEYRTYLDSQAKVVSYGRSGNGPTSFKVWTKGGQVAEYGGTEDASLKAEVKKPDGTLVDGSTIKTWALDKIEDTVGNTLTVHYTKDDETGEQYPNEIDYTGNDGGGLKPYNKVEFIYEDRTDVRDLYKSGSLMRAQKRLKEIRALTLIDGTYQLVYDYHISYEYSPNSGRSRITSIQECNGNGICFKPTTFQWQNKEAGWTTSSVTPPNDFLYIGPNYIHERRGTMVDFLGRGRADFVTSYKSDVLDALKLGTGNTSYLNESPNWTESAVYQLPDYFYQVLPNEQVENNGNFADLNGDGLLDYVASYYNDDSYATKGDVRKTWLNTGKQDGSGANAGEGWSEASDYIPPDYLTRDDGNYIPNVQGQLVDLTGNGLTGFVISYRDWNGTNTNHVWLNNGQGWEANDSFALPETMYGFDRNGEQRYGYFADINGDGLADYITAYRSYTGAQSHHVYLNTGNGWKLADYDFPCDLFYQGQNYHLLPQNQVRSALVDLNGDGLMDVVISYKGYSGDSINQAWINTGNGYIEDPNYETPGDAFMVYVDQHDGPRRRGSFVDLDGDGLPDYVYAFRNGEKKVWINTGSGWKESSTPLPDIVYDAGDEVSQFADVTGNGIADMVTAYSSVGPETHATYVNKGMKPDFLTQITDGVGEKTSIDYEPLSGTYVKVYDQAFKSDGTLDSQYPNPQFDGPMYVVYQTASDTALNDPHTKANYRTNGTEAQAKVFPQSPYSTIPSDADGSQHLTTYHYSGARTNKLGVGFLGFHTMQTTDDTTGITTTVTYSQAPAKHNVNQPETTTTQQADGTILSQTDRTWDLKTYGDGSVNHTYYQPYTKQEVKKTNDLKGNLVSTVTTETTLDNYANPLEVKITTEDSTGTYEVDTKNTYTNDEARWILGELTDTSVTRSAPNTPSLTRTSHFEYDANNGLLKGTLVEPQDSTLRLDTSYQRDNYGNIRETRIVGEGLTPRTTQADYEETGRFVTHTINALGERVSQTTDPRFGKPLSVTDANGLTTHYAYDGWGRLINTVHPDGTQEKNAYQWQTPSSETKGTSFKRRDAIDSVSSGAKNSTMIGIGMNGEPIYATYSVTTQATDANNTPIGPANTKYFDQLNRNVAKTTQGLDGTLIWSDTFYDDIGRVIQQCQSHFDGDTIYSSRFEYDVLGRMTKTTNPDGSIIQVAYDGLKTTTINPLNQKSTKLTNAIGKVTEAIDNEGNKTSYQYDAYGNMTKMIDSQGNSSTITYDKLGRKIGINDPDKGKWSYEYDALGNLLKQSDSEKHTVTMQYDPLNRMISRTDNGNTSTWTYGTDPRQHNVGKLIQETGIANGTGNHPQRRDAIHRVSSPSVAQKLRAIRDGLADYEETIEYDSLGRPSETTIHANDRDYTSQLTYDAAGRVAITRYASNVKIQNEYNALGYLIAKKNISMGGTYWKLNSMDAEGHITSFTRSNGLVTTKTYNPANGFLTDIETKPGSELQLQHELFPTTTHYLSKRRDYIPRVSKTNNNIQSLHYTYDALGNVTKKTNDVAQTTDTYEYDDLDRVTKWAQNGTTKRTYQYDPLGNLTYKSDVGHYHYGDHAGPHAVTSITDDAGKTIEKFLYDAEGNQTNADKINKEASRMIVYTSYGKPSQIHTQDASTTFYYNADRTRFIRVDDRADRGTDTTVYLGDLQFVTHKRSDKT